jgi:putative MATE family efflux protein
MQSVLIVDTLLVAPLGERPLAAMGVATTIVAFVLGIQFALSGGTQLIVGRAKGSQDTRALTAAFAAGLLINASVAAICWFGLRMFGPKLIALLIDDTALIDLASSYLSVGQNLILITAFTQLCSSFFNGCGKTKIPLKGYFIEMPFNIVISYLLIYGLWDYPGLGVVGAAWGTLIAGTIRMSYLFYSLKRSESIDAKAWPRDNFLRICYRHFEEILPIAANFLILTVGMTVYQLLYAKLDLYSYVAITIIYPWTRIGSQITIGWAQASAISISQAIGQKQSQHLRAFVVTSLKLAMLVACIVAALFYLLSQLITIIYPNIATESHSALAAIAPVYILLPLIRTYNTVAGHTMRSMGQSLKVLRIHFVVQWLIAIPVCALMVLHFKLSVFWVFGVVLLEEALKVIPFYLLMKNTLRHSKGPKIDI